jgi:hypothetical protein
MKQQYTILRDDAKGELVIKELAELDKEIMSLLCEETYDAQAIKAEAEKGKEQLIAKLRTRNMYPPYIFADRIADAVLNLYSPDGPATADLFFDDKEFFMKPQVEEALIVEEGISEDSDDIDDLLEEEIDEYGDKKIIKNIKTSIKIAEDEPLDSEEEG